jgi:hypothetical protein
MIEVLEEIVGAPLTLEQLKHKPGRRCTLRARGSGGSAIVKLYSSDRASLVASRIAALGPGPPEPVVPTVLHLDAQLHLVVLSDVPGRALREALLEGDFRACSQAGSALGSWHVAWQGVAPEPLRPHTVDREIEILLSHAGCASPSVARAVADALPPLPQEWSCSTVVHRDLYEEQILVGERVGLIDVDDAALGPPELDLGNLLAHAALLERHRGQGLAREQAAILAGYAKTGPPLDEALLDDLRHLTLLRLACLNDDVGLVQLALAEDVLG